ncbi:hypothetical protein K488DRAFT_51173 [Vararia minispora EC-137]|uniref:Uncharacterized protein n=1 Tax=Vararia minispora EC-137 TaxID=1314806 RepID=A0ACB8QJT6_9AGAM|nr:hypothetical protein K488DRAFT_51173 [Vararia minispora EC-137]
MNVPPPPPLSSNSPAHHSRYTPAASPVPPRPPPPPSSNSSRPHFEQPLAAPRPQRLDPELPANMARTLDEQMSPRGPSPGPVYGQRINPNPGFAMPIPSFSDRGPSPLPPPQGSDWSPWTIPRSSSPSSAVPPASTHRSPSPNTLSSQMGNMSLSTPAPRQRSPTGTQDGGPPSLTAPLPTISSLIAGLSTGQNPSAPPASRIAWARDVLTLAERMFASSASSPDAVNQAGLTDPPSGAVNVSDPELLRLVDVAVPLILQLSSPQPSPPTNQTPPYVAEALYWRASLAASGAYPQHVQPNPRTAFRDFEKAARAGFHKAWFRLGRDYEGFNDHAHAKDCFERGVKWGEESCLYRMGMAHLLGQLGLPASPETALPLLQRAATLATTTVPQPAYVFALVLLGEFAPAPLPPSAFYGLFPPGPQSQSPSPLELEARRHLERAAYLHFAPAQYKLGHAYEFAEPPFAFDPLLSVQYYSLASQQGEVEADMALSKWFLCGAEGAFDKDESLAYVFAEKAARKGLPSAEFAMGYYAEVGVGGEKNIDIARKWYHRAAQHGNSDASDRLAALSQPAPQSLSRQEHDHLTENTLVRKRTQAKNRSDARGPNSAVPRPAMNGQQVVANVRKNSVRRPAGNAPGSSYNRSPRMPAMPPVRENSFGSAPDPGRGREGRQAASEYHPIPQQAPQQAPSHGRRPSASPHGELRARPDQARYTLTDSPSPRPPQGSPSQRPHQQALPGPHPSAQGRPGNASSHSGSVPAPRKGPATFQEMGFQSAKLEDKECIIM